MNARLLTALASGLLFGFGLSLSRMIDPTRVIGFLDVAGDWDPTLGFVMGGALAVSAASFRFVLRRPRPWLAPKFRLPTRSEIDARLVGGAALFGIGWGIAGLCPGPAIANLVYGEAGAIVFVVSMIAGMALYGFLATATVTPPVDAAAKRSVG